MLGMSSASANVGLNTRKDFIRGLTGARFYLPVADARQIPALGKRLVERLILAGHGRAEVSKTGQVLFRTPLDGAVWQPERLDYAAGAHVEPPLEQRREMKTWQADSRAQLTDSILPPLSSEEQSRSRRAQDPAAGRSAGRPPRRPRPSTRLSAQRLVTRSPGPKTVSASCSKAPTRSS